MLTSIPNGLDEINDVFGSLDDPDFEKNNIVQVTFPYPLLYAGKAVLHGRCHKLAVDHFVKALTNVQTAGLQDQVKNYGGLYQPRPIRGQSAHPSTHSWGIAGDFEPAEYPLGSLKRFSDQIVQIFKEAGFMYGGDFKSRKDPMHWQLCLGY